MSKTKVYHIKKHANGRSNDYIDVVVVEEPLEIRLNYDTGHGVLRTMPLSVTMRTPGDDVHLVKGFLLTEGIVSDFDDIESVETIAANVVVARLKNTVTFNADQHLRNTMTSSSCGVCGKASIDGVYTETSYLPWTKDVKVSRKVLLSLTDRMRSHQEEFETTGSAHACALFDLDGDLISIGEDVGRHNAMDKLIGSQLSIPLSQYLVVVSGRASFELIQKAAKVGIAIVCAIGAPSSLAIDLAVSQGITLIGFLKKEKYNVYCGSDRITDISG